MVIGAICQSSNNNIENLWFDIANIKSILTNNNKN